jgi:hypothetical protein
MVGYLHKPNIATDYKKFNIAGCVFRSAIS